jgi:hypothetical protein
MRFFLIDRVIQEEGLYAYNMQNVVGKHLSISIAPVRSQGGSLVIYKEGLCPSSGDIISDDDDDDN